MTDDVGIDRRADRDRDWLDVPVQVRTTVRTAARVEQVVDASTDPAAPWPVDLQRRLLHPASGGPAVLVPRTGGRCVVLGGDRHALGPALGFLGFDVVRADWVYDRLRFQQLAHPVPGGAAMHLDPSQGIPVDDDGLDLVWMDLDELVETLGPRATARVLREIRRALSPGGLLVADARHGGRRAIDAVRRRTVRSRDLVPPSLLLARAGLVTVDRHTLHPDRADWSWLAPRSRARALLAAEDERTGAKRVAARVLRAVGAAGVLAPDGVVVARPRGDAAPPAASVAARAGGAPDPVVTALTDARVAVLGERFVKVPLSPDQQEALGREVAATHEASGTAFAAYVLGGVATASAAGVRVASAPLVRSRPLLRDEAERVLVEVLLSVVPDTVRPLRTTAAWRRLGSDRGARDCAEIGAASLREHVLADLGDAAVPVGPTHGDLHPDNVLRTLAGDTLLVDWNRFELENPLVLDAAYAALQLERESGRTLAQALVALRDGGMHGPLAERADALRGDLSRAQTATLVLLDRVVSYSLPRRRYKPWTMPPLREAVDALLTPEHRPGSG